MKPAHPAHRRDYAFSSIPFIIARAFIVDHHYAHGAANTAVASHGLSRGSVLAASALWLPPTKVCAQTVDAVRWRRVLSLSRLAVLPGEPTNVASMLIGAAVRELRRERKWVALVTFADESQGHTGTIYRASNWTYVGPTKPEPRWLDPSTGRQVSRLATKSRTAAQMRALGYECAGRFSKHKFTLVLWPVTA